MNQVRPRSLLLSEGKALWAEETARPRAGSGLECSRKREEACVARAERARARVGDRVRVMGPDTQGPAGRREDLALVQEALTGSHVQ